MGIFDKDRLKASDLFDQAFNYVSSKYGQGKELLTAASPVTQIMEILSEMGELIFMYNENSISEMNIETAQNADNIRGGARANGHNATRGMCAVGKLKIGLKPNIDFDGEYLVIPKYTQLEGNQLEYILLPETDIRLTKNSRETIYVPLVQGRLERQTFVADGTSMFSFSAMIKGMTDHFRVNVYVNGEKWDPFVGLYDMNKNDKGYLVKTGINGGLDFYFGTGIFGRIPDAGSTITVEYIITDGSSGNVNSITDFKLSYEGFGVTKYGDDIDLNEVLQTEIVMKPTMGSDTEDVEFTRLMAPSVSKSHTLLGPENYIYFLRRYNYFSMIDAYNTIDDVHMEDDNVIYLFLLPDVNKKISSSVDYFHLNESEFVLNTNEKEMVRAVINESGQQRSAQELSFIDPIIKRYGINIVLRYFDNIETSQIRSEIYNKLNLYFLSVKRRDKIPRSDLISIIESVEGVDSVNVYFVSEENESAITNGSYVKNFYAYNESTQKQELIQSKRILVADNEDPNLGLDEFGDILIEKNELPIIRGGWKDRDNKFYETYPDNSKLSALNIYFKEKVDADMYNKMMNKARKTL